MVKLTVGGSVFSCETAEEAVKIHRMLAQPESAGIAVKTQTGVFTQTVNTGTFHPGKGVFVSFVKKIEPLAGKHVSSEEFAKVIGAKNPNGLGPKIAQLRKVVAHEGIQLDDYVQKTKLDPEGPTLWRITVPASAA